MDFSSSGLENPLVHLLLAIYVVIYVSNLEWEKKFLFSCFVYGLVYLTRPNTIADAVPQRLFIGTGAEHDKFADNADGNHYR